MRFLTIVLFAFLASCSDSLEDQAAKLETFVKNNRYGSGGDVWLVKRNAFGDHEKVSLVFGFLDDFEFCTEVAAMYNQRYPNASLYCAFAN